MGLRIGAQEDEMKDRYTVSHLMGCIFEGETVNYKNKTYLADGREYICPSKRWSFVQNLIQDELIYDYMSLMARASNYELGTVEETEQLCKRAIEKFGFQKIPGSKKVFVTRQYVDEVIRQTCLVNCYKERATVHLVMKVLDREYFLENWPDKYVREHVAKELARQPEKGQDRNR